MPPPAARLPVIDISGLRGTESERRETGEAIRAACRDTGFFYVVGHGIDTRHIRRLESLSREFFALPLEEKLEIEMTHGGRAWRGYFPVGRELTSGRPDIKEGLYFGTELPADHPKVLAGTPLHGANLFPRKPTGLRAAVLQYLDAVTDLGHLLARGLSRSLGRPESFLAERYTADPLVLFRIFHYPALAGTAREEWSVGEHTDYGLLTILWQDEAGGLEIRSNQEWIAAPPLPDSFLCNLGDMLDRMTGGRYRSTPHRVRNLADRPRLSFALFFDPAFDTTVEPIEAERAALDDRADRWDGASVHDFCGTYGEYLLGKVSRVFPELGTRFLTRRSR